MPRIQLRHGLQLAKGVDVADVAVEAADAGVVKEVSQAALMQSLIHRYSCYA